MTQKAGNGYDNKCYRSCSSCRSRFSNNDLRMRFSYRMSNCHRQHKMRKLNRKWPNGVRTSWRDFPGPEIEQDHVNPQDQEKDRPVLCDVNRHGHKMMTNELGGAYQMRMQTDLDLGHRNRMTQQPIVEDVTDRSLAIGLRLDRASEGLNVPHDLEIEDQKDTVLRLNHQRQNDTTPALRRTPTRTKDQYCGQDQRQSNLLR